MCTLFKYGKYATAIRSFKRVHAHFRNDYALTARFSLPPQFYETLFKQPFPRTTFSGYKKQRIDEIAFLPLSSPRSIIRYILRINKYLLYDNDHCIRPLPKLPSIHKLQNDLQQPCYQLLHPSHKNPDTFKGANVSKNLRQ